MTSPKVLAEDVTEKLFMNLVAQLGEAVAQFLGWAAACLAEDRPLRLRDREDLAEARTMTSEFDKPWWGIVVYTCFGAVQGARPRWLAVRDCSAAGGGRGPARSTQVDHGVW